MRLRSFLAFVPAESTASGGPKVDALLKVPTVLGRGLRDDVTDLTNYRSMIDAYPIVYPAFTTDRVGTALSFAAEGGDPGFEGILLTIVVGAQLQWRVIADVSAYSEFKDESEFVCLPGPQCNVRMVSAEHPQHDEIAGLVPVGAVGRVTRARLQGIVEPELREKESAWPLL